MFRSVDRLEQPPDSGLTKMLIFRIDVHFENQIANGMNVIISNIAMKANVNSLHVLLIVRSQLTKVN